MSSAIGRDRWREASCHHCASHSRQRGSATASATVACPSSGAVYAKSEWAPLRSQSLRLSNGMTSATKRAPASSHRGLPAGKRPESTHSEKGSVTTGAESVKPPAELAWSRAAVVAAGGNRSTIVVLHE